MKTFVINMKKDIVKRDNILSQLKHHPELDAHIIEACEGKKLEESELERLGYKGFKAKYGDFGTLPAFGCSVSHFSVYNRMVSNNEQLALILEDDVILGNDIANVMPALINVIASADAPIAILLTPDFIYQSKNEPVAVCGDYKVVSCCRGYMTTGYIVNFAAAKLLTSKLIPIRHVADDWSAFKKMGLNVYGVVPHLVSYSGELGEIGRSQRGKREPIHTQIRHVFGRAKAKIHEISCYFKGYRRSKRLW